jgi:hypothetical protein
LLNRYSTSSGNTTCNNLTRHGGSLITAPESCLFSKNELTQWQMLEARPLTDHRGKS